MCECVGDGFCEVSLENFGEEACTVGGDDACGECDLVIGVVVSGHRDGEKNNEEQCADETHRLGGGLV